MEITKYVTLEILDLVLQLFFHCCVPITGISPYIRGQIKKKLVGLASLACLLSFSTASPNAVHKCSAWSDYGKYKDDSGPQESGHRMDIVLAVGQMSCVPRNHLRLQANSVRSDDFLNLSPHHFMKH